MNLSLAHRVSLASYIPRHDPNQEGCCSIDGNCGPCYGGNVKCCQFGDFCYTCDTKSPPPFHLDFIKGNAAQGLESMNPTHMLHPQKNFHHPGHVGVVNEPDPGDK
uniref:Uncharacterized protein n=1 Tax=Chenopodium quinoa TaxID=63459 RepID=A0A803MHB8_CHEQI